jgi:hypothetical protein
MPQRQRRGWPGRARSSRILTQGVQPHFWADRWTLLPPDPATWLLSRQPKNWCCPKSDTRSPKIGHPAKAGCPWVAHEVWLFPAVWLPRACHFGQRLRKRRVHRLADRPDMISHPNAIAGVIRNASWMRQRLKWTTYRLTAATCFANFFAREAPRGHADAEVAPLDVGRTNLALPAERRSTRRHHVGTPGDMISE